MHNAQSPSNNTPPMIQGPRLALFSETHEFVDKQALKGPADKGEKEVQSFGG